VLAEDSPSNSCWCCLSTSHSSCSTPALLPPCSFR